MSPSAERANESNSADIRDFFETNAALHKTWLRELHRRAELSFDENETAKYVTGILETYASSLEVSRPYEKAPTAVIAVYNPAVKVLSPILLRADMDALRITGAEIIRGRLHEDVHHGCGHDGHMTCLLATGHYLHELKQARRKIVLVFQPAEERGRGAARLLASGLLNDHYDVTAVYALHCWPGLPVGTFGVGAGTIMAGSGRFGITVRGNGGHAATPDPGKSEALLAGCAIVTTGQSIVSRMVKPFDSAVVSFTKVENVGSDGDNVCPCEVVVRGTIRCMDGEVRKVVIERVKRMAEGVASGYGCIAKCVFLKGHPATKNSIGGSRIAREAACKVGSVKEVGSGEGMVRPSLCAEDFSELLKKRSGAYVWMGNGEESAELHTSQLKFCEEAVCMGGRYFSEISVAADCTECIISAEHSS